MESINSNLELSYKKLKEVGEAFRKQRPYKEIPLC